MGPPVGPPLPVDATVIISTEQNSIMFAAVITFGDELEYVWMRYFGLGVVTMRLLYELGATFRPPTNSSYLPGDLVAIAPSLQKIAQRLDPITGSVLLNWTPLLVFGLFYSVEIILQTRVYAMYHSARLAIVNGVLFCVEIALMLYLWSTVPLLCGFEYLLSQQLEGPWISFCGRGDGLPLYWVPGIVYELWLSACALFKLVQRLRQSGKALLHHDTLSLLARDSIIYFALIAVGIAVHIGTGYLGHPDVGIIFVEASLCVGGSRIVLHLRRAFYVERAEEGDLRLSQFSFPLSRHSADSQGGPPGIGV
ncbi:hypothetical protein AURDEDRAFT_172188 [Auricularia subglabra TFB-10046 SS5]|nr:hypothetical protein AURDEDRAFT_172188 [Auricularia subglabra TFB-10046 SS5]